MFRYEHLKIGEACTLSTFASYTGLKIDEMHLAVQVSMREYDKYAILENIEQMIEEARKNPNSNIQAYFVQTPINAAEAEMKLEDLRRWFVTEFLHDNFENCNKVMEMRRVLAEKEGEMKQKDEEMRQREKGWEAEKKGMEARMEAMNKKDEWASRVTYEAVVEQIAACEDARSRDEARKLIEPLLKKEMATKFRKDIKLRAKELNEGGEPRILNVAGNYNDIHDNGTVNRA